MTINNDTTPEPTEVMRGTTDLGGIFTVEVSGPANAVGIPMPPDVITAPEPQRTSPSAFQSMLTNLKEIAQREIGLTDYHREYQQWAYFLAMGPRLELACQIGAIKMPDGEISIETYIEEMG